MTPNLDFNKQAWCVLTDYASYDFQSYELPENHGFNRDLLQWGIDADDIDIDATTVFKAFPQSFNLSSAFEAKADDFDDEAFDKVAQATLDAFKASNPRLVEWLKFRETFNTELTTDQVCELLCELLPTTEQAARDILCYALDNGKALLLPTDNGFGSKNSAKALQAEWYEAE